RGFTLPSLGNVSQKIVSCWGMFVNPVAAGSVKANGRSADQDTRPIGRFSHRRRERPRRLEAAAADFLFVFWGPASVDCRTGEVNNAVSGSDVIGPGVVVVNLGPRYVAGFALKQLLRTSRRTGKQGDGMSVAKERLDEVASDES